MTATAPDAHNPRRRDDLDGRAGRRTQAKTSTGKPKTQPGRMTRMVAPPGECFAVVTVWEADDPSKQNDPRYWYTPDLMAALRRLNPTADVLLNGRALGFSLARMRSVSDEELVYLESHREPVFRVLFSLACYRDADPEQTGFNLYFSHGDEELLLPEGCTAVPEVEAARSAVSEARVLGDENRLAAARRDYYTVMADQCIARPVGADFDMEGLVELQPCLELASGVLQPGLYVDDQRPRPKRTRRTRRTSTASRVQQVIAPSTASLASATTHP